MPVPTGPRRAAPPRKRVPKTPSPAIPSPTEESKDEGATSMTVTETTSAETVKDGILAENTDVPATALEGDRQPEKTTSQIEALLARVDIASADVSQPVEPVAQHTDDADEGIHDHSEQVVHDHTTDEPSIAAVTDVQTAALQEPAVEPVPAEESHYEEPAVSVPPAAETEVEEEEEEDEIARRKRIAERLSKSGGINPFAAPPPRLASTQDEAPVVEDDREVASAHSTGPEQDKTVLEKEEQEGSGVTAEEDEPGDGKY